MIERSKSSYKLSICISTLNRANVICKTLDNIISQVKNNCEIVILDAASSDNTQALLNGYAERWSFLRYIRQEENNGIDQDYDRTVQLAHGEYCWLMSDDDELKAGALDKVLGAIHQGYSLIVVNSEMRDEDLSTIVVPSLVDIKSDTEFRSDALDELFRASSRLTGYIGCVVIKRELWLARRRVEYYGSWFIHIAVMFQDQIPGKSLLISEPLIAIRLQDSWWAPKVFEIMLVKLPDVVWSLPISDSAKKAMTTRIPWRSFRQLLPLRALDLYSFDKYCEFIRPRILRSWEGIIPLSVALIPGVVANTALLAFYSLFYPRVQSQMISKLRQSNLCASWFRLT